VNKQGETMDPEKIMSGISEEILISLQNMKKAKTSEEKLTYSKTIKNLCKSLGVFLNLMMNDMNLYDDNDEAIPF
jgi:DNA-binding Xre family transcriptional regulator